MLETIDKGLIRLIRKKTSKLNPKDIAQSLRRLDFRIESPRLAGPPGIPRVTPPPKPKIKRKKPGESQRVDFGVTLADLISAGLLTPPLRLFREYKGNPRRASATCNLTGAADHRRKQGRIHRGSVGESSTVLPEASTGRR